MPIEYEISAPKPCSLVESLRSVGYTLSTAVADILDNSITAKAKAVWIDFHWAGPSSCLTVMDDGTGMTELQLVDAMRPGSANPLDARGPNDLGRFGLGLKTASFSQCRKLTVWSKKAGGSLHGRCWDLDYVAAHDEWRLLKALPPAENEAFDRFTDLAHGTLVIWECLDRVVDQSPSGSKVAQALFLNHVREVGAHLSMIFHRYIEGTTAAHRPALRIYLNGTKKENLVQPWNPFSILGAPSPKESPVEPFLFGGLTVNLRGFVLPHKDRLSDEQSRVGGGPNGWLAQQGFYIYRNDRILVAGDWLRLGRARPWAKEEQFKLARLSIDIPNAMDHLWSLDIKKSTAKPPAIIRDSLTDLAEAIRDDARRVFSHRGEYGARNKATDVVIARPWIATRRSNRIVYRINKEHPLVAETMKKLGVLAADLNPMLRLIEETIPIQKIWLDTAESPDEHAVPYEGQDEKILLNDIRMSCDFLARTISSKNSLRSFLLATEPFNRYQNAVDMVLQERN